VTPPGNTVSWNFSGPPALNQPSNQPGPVVLASLSPGAVFAGVGKTQEGDGCTPANCGRVPEPGTLLLVGSGLVGVGLYWGRKGWFSGFVG
jgi:hypothetical protein